jgi:hypothetical protein
MALPWGYILGVVGTVVAGAVLGLLFVPAVGFLLGKSAKLEALARIQWTIAQLVTDKGSVLVEQPTGEYTQHVVRRADDDADHDAEYYDGGEWQPLTTKARWSRLGKRPFGVTALPEKDTFDGYAESHEDLQSAATDGGVPQRERAGEIEWIPDEILAKLRDMGGWLVETSHFRVNLHGEGGMAGSEDAQREAKAKYGGSSEISQKWVAIGVMGMFVVSLVISLLFFGGGG